MNKTTIIEAALVFALIMALSVSLLKIGYETGSVVASHNKECDK